MVEKDFKSNMPPDSKKEMNQTKSHNKEIIHSGHFMVSDIDDTEKPNEPETKSYAVHESDHDQETAQASEYDFEIECQETSKTYTYGPRSSQSISIDASLTKLFECMTLAYSGKLTSPRWKTFKGLKLRLKDKIRLNNIIWRAWHLQFVAKQTQLICQFATPLEVDHHTVPESVIVEGKYWRREFTTVTAEYKKWRLFYKDRSKRSKHPEIEKMDLDYIFPSISTNVDPNLYMDFNTALFNNWAQPHQPYQFDIPNPKEIAAKAGIAEFIQPGLGQLQPSMDDFMDTFQSLQDFLPSRLAPVTEELSDNSSIQDFLSPGSSQQNTFEGNESDCFSTLSDAVPDHMTLPSNKYIQPQDETSRILDSLISDSNSSESRGLPSTLSPPHPNAILPQGAVVSNFVPFAPEAAPAPPLLHSKKDVHILPSEQPPLVVKPDSSYSLGQPQRTKHHPKSKNLHYSKSSVAKISKTTQDRPSPSLFPSQDVGRRHSYASAQMLPKDHSPPRTTANNLPFSSNTISGFVVPESPVKPRVRSRSVSMPQSNLRYATVGTPPPTQAVSLTNIHANSSKVLPQNALIAQLLTSSPSIQNNQTPLNIPCTTTAVAIISQPPQQALVLSPLALTPVSTLSTSVHPPGSVSLNRIGPAPATTPPFAAIVPPAVSSPSTPAGPPSLAAMVSVQSPKSSSPAAPTSPDTSVNSPPPPVKPFKPKSDEERVQYKEHRRVCHINAEQKRRFNIKSGFETLRQLLPSLSQSPTTKISKAAMLQKAVDYVQALKAERAQQNEEIMTLKTQIESLTEAINSYQSQLPAGGLVTSSRPSEQLRDLYREYIHAQTLSNWKFWIFSLMLNPLLESYSRCTASCVTIEEFCKAALGWVEKHCTLVTLRPVVLNALRHLSTNTNVLTDPAKLPEEVVQRITKQEF